MLKTEIRNYETARRTVATTRETASATVANSERWAAFDAIVNAPATCLGDVADKLEVAIIELRQGNGTEALRLLDAVRAELAGVDDE